MNEKEYIESGMLESYCLGTLDPDGQDEVLHMCKLYPVVKAELENIEAAMEDLAFSLAIDPSASVKERTMRAIFEVQPLDVNALPFTDATSDLDAWLEALAHLIPEEHTEVFYHHLLRHDDLVTQALVISKVNIPDETHDDLIESFFILEGSCRCVIDGNAYILNAGDFLEIPLHQHHDVELLTPYVVAVHQQLALSEVSL
jgi:mannose-6-phosphate isomerase-like protein (cupin superfamily)